MQHFGFLQLKKLHYEIIYRLFVSVEPPVIFYASLGDISINRHELLIAYLLISSTSKLNHDYRRSSTNSLVVNLRMRLNIQLQQNSQEKYKATISNVTLQRVQ